ncbi:dolichyl-phosphate-mannose--protein mannosyltransferase [Microbacterium album]|uniref:Polyprenol-phosphate-mannose--protein mannosyltransferase n=1 Tax=Microbacterium album TaxID=2053191 RepID=A0A917IDQ5_9MICO|nr:phospholipid carrier-dependent glycosyltransferase [Microbacterium album]GGH37975.1 dolichyl-phosphate-mannose--protein mannosyltransferase [Microbacterium album]
MTRERRTGAPRGGDDAPVRTPRYAVPESLVRWLVPLALTVLAAVPRFTALWHPHTLVFDETYYVKDAWTLLHLGYEGSWPEEADARFLAGDTGAFGTDPAYVVHPPLGKWLIAVGLAVFGAESGWGWRFSAALFGTLLVPLVYGIARRLSGSVAVGAVAGGLLALDGLAIALSRVALLDGFLAFFVTLAFWFVLLDRERTRGRLATSAGPGGPVLWRRPWILAAGVALGAASAVKWSGLYVLAAVGILLVVQDALERRRAGVRRWLPAATLRQGPVTFLLLVPAALAVYLASWTGWLSTSGGYDRGSDPNPLAALWNYHTSIYGFHVGLASPHPYASPAWQWPLLLRPTAMWVDRPEHGAADCGWAPLWDPGDCIAVIGSHPNPVTWYAAWAAVILAAVLLIARRAGRDASGLALALTGLAATYVPWLLYPERTVFQFYTVAMLPFLVIVLALVLGRLTRPRDPITLPDPSPAELAAGTRAADAQARAWRAVVFVFLVVAVLTALFFLPLSTGILEPYPLWRLHNWLPGWV